MERAVALTRLTQIGVDDLPDRVREHRAEDLVLGGADPTELRPLAEVEDQYILHVMETLGGNRTTAARVLDIDRKTLYRRLKSLGYEQDE